MAPSSTRSSSSFGSLVLLIIMAYAAREALAADYIVGDNQQWTTIGDASAYTKWASEQNFVVGDTLVFNFATGSHNVLEVSSSNYDSCNAVSPTATYGDGPARVTLSRSGTYYFICGIPNHCTGSGQKMTLQVEAASPPTSSPPNVPPPARPTSPPSTASPPRRTTTPTPTAPPPATTPSVGGNALPPTTSTPSSPSPTQPSTGSPSNGKWEAAAALALSVTVAALAL